MNLSGAWGYGEDELRWPFHFSRLSPEFLLCRPSPNAFRRNRIRALWSFALTATLSQVRRALFSWSYLKERRAARLEYMEILQRQLDNAPADTDHRRLFTLHRRLTCDDVRMCHVIQEHLNSPPQVLIW